MGAATGVDDPGCGEVEIGMLVIARYLFFAE